MPKPPKLLHLDEIEALPGPGSLTWLPVRYSLGLHAFGCNAYKADEAGVDVVEPHTEDPDLAHEELYFVARGSATFTIDEQTYQAPRGTYVFVPDPASHRHATADEPGTVVLSFGGPPSFQPSAWEWTFRAAATRGDAARARQILHDGLRVHPESPSLHYGLACIAARAGELDQAFDSLARAIEQEPELKAWARREEDLESLRQDPRFDQLTA